MMSVDDLDTEVFIQLVEPHPVIWNIGSEEYKDKRLRDAAWEAVAEQMVDEFDLKTSSEKRDIVKKLAAKWRNIRDTYSKSEKKRRLSSQSSSKVRKYIYARHLHFLKISAGFAADPLPIEDRADMSPTTMDKSAEWTEINGESDKDNDEKMHMFVFSDASPVHEAAAQPDQHRREPENPVMMYANPHVRMETPDEDQSFFNSLLPSVRKLNDDEKLEFRSEVLDVLKRIKRGY